MPSNLSSAALARPGIDLHPYNGPGHPRLGPVRGDALQSGSVVLGVSFREVRQGFIPRTRVDRALVSRKPLQITRVELVVVGTDVDNPLATVGEPTTHTLLLPALARAATSPSPMRESSEILGGDAISGEVPSMSVAVRERCDTIENWSLCHVMLNPSWSESLDRPPQEVGGADHVSPALARPRLCHMRLTVQRHDPVNDGRVGSQPRVRYICGLPGTRPIGTGGASWNRTSDLSIIRSLRKISFCPGASR